MFATDTDPAWTADGQIRYVRRIPGVADQVLTKPAPRPDSWRMPLPRPGDAYPIASALQAPIAYAPEPAADGRSVAYITWESTTRAINFMRLGESARRVVEYTADDGIELSQLAITSKGDAVAFVRGGAPNSQGDSPNPRSLPDPPQREIWVAGTRAGSPRNLGLGTAPVFSPEDARLVWLNGSTIMGVTLTWAADGRLADVGTPAPLATFASGAVEPALLARRRQDRVPARLGGRGLRHRGGDHLGRAAAERLRRRAGLVARRRRASRSGGRSRASRGRSGWPELATQATRQVWQGTTGVGSAFYQLDQNPTFQAQPGDQLLWSDDDRLAFAWEADGYRHLYSVPLAGGAGDAADARRGRGRVGRADARPQADRLHDQHRRQRSQAPVLGRRSAAAPPVALTGGRESQWAPTPLAEGHVAYINAGWATPPAVTVRAADGSSERARLPVVPASFPAEHMVEPRWCSSRPPTASSSTASCSCRRTRTGCASIFPHGGPRRAMLPGFHYYDTYSNLYVLNQYLASRGCVVLSVDYRGGIMHGYTFRNAPDTGTTQASEYRDILGGVNFLKARADVDPERIGTHGLSWGGYLVALGLARNSEIFKVGFDMAGTHAGPIAAINTWNSPVMLVQGDDDRNVNFSQGTNLVRELLTKRPHVELVQRVFPNEVHDMYLTFEDTIDTYNMGAQFMLDHLIGRASTEVPGDVGGTVPPTLSLSLGGGAGFGAFTPGVARDYSANVAATVTSSAGDATLTVADLGTASPGRLVNGSFALAQPLQVAVGDAFAPLPAAVRTWAGPTSSEAVTVGFKQSIGASEPLRTGAYSKTLTFTLSTTNP